ncbi:hypothetical protein [Rhodopseudomonas palustris]|uniref:Uncharacterized protein n=1 Tax=Rhodopseudomonas palustris (strain ATCC BAA-98 / CGA009) TaxID=258594 RepID=A0AAE9Y117_RHOPA|nr:hypothetical protein [Rhodopseudomonas palustris]WAB79432.1 hypothetical protein OR798_09095 [Rhodopseudomonas palustris]WCL91911.1 hypothetical protein TX73_009090 [Rhodopseudomonas palustris CGA009]WND53328.1 hypothetical protein L1A21_09060 [Rhodopseudomonas palustris]
MDFAGCLTFDPDDVAALVGDADQPVACEVRLVFQFQGQAVADPFAPLRQAPPAGEGL